MKQITKNTFTEMMENNIDPGSYYSERVYGARDPANKEPNIFFERMCGFFIPKRITKPTGTLRFTQH